MTSTSPEKTFRALKRVPLEEMEAHLRAARPIYAPMTIHSSSVSEASRYYEIVQCLKQYGWEFEDYVFEIEKRNIKSAIHQHNIDCAFPTELVERAKRFFPNARFVQAEIILE